MLTVTASIQIVLEEPGSARYIHGSSEVTRTCDKSVQMEKLGHLISDVT